MGGGGAGRLKQLMRAQREGVGRRREERCVFLAWVGGNYLFQQIYLLLFFFFWGGDTHTSTHTHIHIHTRARAQTKTCKPSFTGTKHL